MRCARVVDKEKYMTGRRKLGDQTEGWRRSDGGMEEAREWDGGGHTERPRICNTVGWRMSDGSVCVARWDG